MNENRDSPNGWAPIQHMIIEGLSKSGSIEAKSMAEDIAIRWIRTNYVAYKRTGTMHEKYNVENCGDFGGGGEYVPQVSFYHNYFIGFFSFGVCNFHYFKTCKLRTSLATFMLYVFFQKIK